MMTSQDEGGMPSGGEGEVMSHTPAVANSGLNCGSDLRTSIALGE